ncbi:MAG: 3-hydroxyacyl-CoA dehydrogenase [Congregibacter sp.]
MRDSNDKVACIGVGNVGRAWAIVFARAGFEVSLYDVADGAVTQALALVHRNAVDLEAAGLVDSAAALTARIHPAHSLADALAGVRHAQESVREDPQIKAAVFLELAAVAPESATLASSTSAIPGSAFLEHVPCRERCIVAHPVNPPSLIPLVELCPAPWTSPDTIESVRTLMREVGQHPILLKKEIPGFLLNRLQYTLVAEALHLVGEGYCEPEDIDAVLTHGLALRWMLMGPFQVAHLNAAGGFSGFVEQLGEMMRTVGKDARTDYQWDDTLIEQIHERLAASTPVSEIPDRQLERDRNIMSLLNWRKEL